MTRHHKRPPGANRWYARGLPEGVGQEEGFRRSLREFPSHLNGFTVLTGVIPAFVFMITFSALQIELLSPADIAESAIVAWVSVSWFLGGLVAIVLSLAYKRPIAGAWSIPGFILVGTLLGEGQATVAEVFGAFWLSGAIVLLLGITGTIRTVVALLPLPVILAMVGGILIQFPIDMIVELDGADTAPLVIAGILGYFLFDQLGGPFRRVPGVAGSIVFGAAVAGFQGQVDFTRFAFELGNVAFHTPEFSLSGFLTVSIPLVIMVVGAENMQATGVLKAAGQDPPLNSMTTISGVGGMAAASLGSENANVAGPTTAIMNSPEAGPPEGRYVASTISGITYSALGVLGGTIVALIGAFPGALATILLGMVMIRVVIGAIRQAWESGRFIFGAFFAFVIALSDISFLGISAPFWSLVGGATASLLFEFGDYRLLLHEYRSGRTT